MLQHPRMKSIATHPATRPSFIALLSTLFHKHPSNTCQPSHIYPLVDLYGGTLSHPDVLILSIFNLFERHRKISVSSVLTRWTVPATGSGSTSGSAFSSLTSLDPNMLFRAFSQFPRTRSCARKATPSEYKDDIYDPVFVLLLMARLPYETSNMKAMQWVELFRTNAVSVAALCLSSKDSSMRELAFKVLGTLWNSIQVNTMFPSHNHNY